MLWSELQMWTHPKAAKTEVDNHVTFLANIVVATCVVAIFI